MRSEMRYPFYLGAGVRFGIPRKTIFFSGFFALAKIYTAGQLSNDGEVDAAAYFGFERRDGDEGVGGKVAGS